MRTGRVLGALLAVALGVAPEARAEEPAWRLEQPRPPAGAPFPSPLGAPGDLRVLAPNRALLAVAGTAVVPAGLYRFDGVEWQPLSTVCGGAGATTRIAVAGPGEFWTIADPATPAGAKGSERGVTLCRFAGGQVAASYAVPPEALDPYLPMNAAACLAPDDCWFGGVAGRPPDGARSGAFHLHWDGRALETVYASHGRGVSDLEAVGARLFATTFLGARADGADPATPEPAPGVPRLLKRLVDGRFEDDPFLPAPVDGLPEDAHELLALDADDEGGLWAVGGGASSGRHAGDVVRRGPLAARFVDGGFRELELTPGAFAPDERFVDAAALDDGGQAWVAVEPWPRRGSPEAAATVARLAADGTVLERVRVPSSGSPRGTASRIGCWAPQECWLATSAGWLYRLTAGAEVERDTDPAFAGLITRRPPDGRTPQAQLDGVPEDDSLRFAPPPVEVDAQAAPVEAEPRRLPALMRQVRSRLVGRRTLVVSFRLVRRARVGLVALRGRRTVGRVRQRTLRPGRRALRLRLHPRRWPTRLRFTIRDSAAGVAAPEAEPTADVAPDAPAVIARATGARRAGS